MKTRSLCLGSLRAATQLSLALLALAATPPAPAEPADIVWASGGHAGGIIDLALSPDGQILATTGQSDGTIKLWSVADGSLIRTIGAFSTEVRDIAYSPDGQLIAAGGTSAFSQAGTVRVFRASGGELVYDLNPAAIYDVTSVSFSADGTHLAAATADFNTALKIWNLSDGSLQTEIFAPPFNARVAFSPADNDLVAFIGSFDVLNYSLFLFRVSDGSLVNNLAGPTFIWSSVGFTPDGSQVAVGNWGGFGGDGRVTVWNIADGTVAHEFSGPPGSSVFGFAFSPSGTRVAAGGNDDIDPNQPDALHGIRAWNTSDESLLQDIPAFRAGMNAVVFDGTGDSIIACGAESAARRWELETGSLVQTFGMARGPVNAVAFSPDQQQLAAAGTLNESETGGDVELFSPTAGQPLGTLVGHTDLVNAVAFSADSSLIATGAGAQPPDTRDPSIRIWNALTQAELRILTGHVGGTTAVAFSPTAPVLASGGRDTRVRIWDVSSGDNTHTLAGHVGSVRAVAFSPDGQVLASAGSTVRLCSGSDFSFIRELTTGAIANSISFSPDGTLLAVGLDALGNNVQVWRVADGMLLNTIDADPLDFAEHVTFTADGAALIVESQGYPPMLRFFNPLESDLMATIDSDIGWRLGPAVAVSADNQFIGLGRADATVSVIRNPLAAGPPCPGDVDGSLTVDLTDLAILLSNFGLTGTDRAHGDLDGDGDVDLSDLATLLANFGATCT